MILIPFDVYTPGLITFFTLTYLGRRSPVVQGSIFLLAPLAITEQQQYQR